MLQVSIDPYFAAKTPAFFLDEDEKTLKCVLDSHFRTLTPNFPWAFKNHGCFKRVRAKKTEGIVVIQHQLLNGRKEEFSVNPGEVVSVSDGLFQVNPFNAWELKNKMPCTFVGSTRYEETLQDKYLLLKAALAYAYCTTPRNPENEECERAEDEDIRALISEIERQGGTRALGAILSEEIRDYLEVRKKAFTFLLLLNERGEQVGNEKLKYSS